MGWQNGMYRVYGGGIRLDIRVALGIDPELTRVVSCDVYNPGTPTSTTADQYVGSYWSKVLSDPPGTDPLVVTLAGIAVNAPGTPAAAGSSAENPSGTITLTLEGTDGGDPPLRATFTSEGTGCLPNGPFALQTAPGQQGPLLHGTYRAIQLEVAFQDGFSLPGAAVTPSEPKAPALRFDACLANAGIRVFPSRQDPLPSDVLPANAGGLLSLAYNASVNRDLESNNVTSHVFLMVVDSLAGDNLAAGLMFDLERRSASVFSGSISRYYKGNDDEVSANSVFTLVHEIGHCLNLPHVFEPHPDWVDATAATFMNYPQNFKDTGQPGSAGTFSGGQAQGANLLNYLQFWGQFKYQFAPKELLYLRHGPRDLILPGGIKYWGEFGNDPTAAFRLGEADGASLTLGLRLRPKRPGGIFDFGEPIHVELELRDDGRAEREITRRLSPTTQGVEIHYETPDGRFETYRPPFVLSALPSSRVLTPEAPAIYKDICVSHSLDKFAFLQPGRYRIRAAYTHEGTTLVSNILPVYVRYPTRDDEDRVVPTLHKEVATYVALRGVSGLKCAGPLLEEYVADDPKHPLHRFYHAYEGILSLQPSVVRDAKTRRIVGVEPPAPKPDHFRRAFGVQDIGALGRADFSHSALPISNIMLTRWGVEFFQALNDAGESGLARKLLTRIESGLQTRGVPERVREAFAQRCGARASGSDTNRPTPKRRRQRKPRSTR